MFTRVELMRKNVAPRPKDSAFKRRRIGATSSRSRLINEPGAGREFSGLPRHKVESDLSLPDLAYPPELTIPELELSN